MAASFFASQGFVLFARLLVASVFLMAGAAKLAQRQTFARDVQQYRLLPSVLARGYAFVLPWVELLVAVSLFSGVLARAAAGLALLLLLSFVFAVTSAMKRRLNLTCQCFGLLYRERVGSATLARDGILALLAVEVAAFDRGRFALPAAVAGLPRAADLVALIITIAALTPSLAVAALAFRALRPGPIVSVPVAAAPIESGADD